VGQLMLRTIVEKVDTSNCALADLHKASEQVLGSYAPYSVAYITVATATLLGTLERSDKGAAALVADFFLQLCFHALDKCAERGTAVPLDLQELLVMWLNGDAEATSKHTLPAAILPSVTHRRLVLERLVEVGLDGSLVLLKDPLAAQLYLQMLLDRAAEDKSTDPVIADGDKQKLVLQGTGKVDLNYSTTFVESLANARQTLEVCARRLVIGVSSPNFSPEEATDDSVVEVLLANKHSAVYLLKLVKNYFGMETVCKLITKAHTQLPWLPLDAEQAAAKLAKPRVFDAMGWATDEAAYKRVCKAVQLALTKRKGAQSDLNTLFYKDAKTPEDDAVRCRAESLLLAATFSQFTRLYSALSSDTARQYASWLGQYASAPGRSSLFRRCAKWMTAPSTRDLPIAKLEDSQEELLLHQLAVHLAAWALEHPGCWLERVIMDPSSMLLSFIPSMPEDPMTVIHKAMGSRMGWYRCPNGHPYTVGECTMPMQTSRCIQCGAVIGGRSHVSVKGVTRMNVARDKVPPKGYCIASACEETMRRDGTAMRVIRFLLHLAMHMSFVTAHTEVEQSMIAQLVQRNMTFRACKAVVEERLLENWRVLKETLRIGNADLALSLHLTLDTMSQHSQLWSHGNLVSHHARNRWEEHFLAKVGPLFARGGLRSRLESLASFLQSGGVASAIQAAIGPAVWARLCELPPPEQEGDWQPPLDELQWRFREEATFASFSEAFAADEENAVRHPLLAAFLQVERRLPLIQYLSSVLAWHAVLFEAFPPESITREEAVGITNAMAIARLPPHRRAAAEAVLEEYCRGFNLALPQVELIFQCEANPFRTIDGKIDLSGVGQGGGMDADTPVTFSLPSALQGIVDAPGLCTLRVVELLQQTHNSVLEALQSGGGAAPAEEEALPSVSYLTPAAAVRQQLIVYERARDFLPLVRAHSLQPPRMASSGQAYDMAALEAALEDRLLAGVQPLAAHVRHFQFRGDMKQAGRLAGLRQILEQRALPPHTLNALWGEVDTQHHLLQIMRMVEMCINFLVMTGDAAGAGRVDPSLLFADYARNALLVDAAAWEELRTPTIASQVQLCHLQALFMALEERMHGSPFDAAVGEEFRLPLPAEAVNVLTAGMAFYDTDLLLPVLRDFMLENLRHCSPDLELKEYLEYQHDDLIDLEWFQNYFPDSILLRHCFATFEWLSEKTSATD